MQALGGNAPGVKGEAGRAKLVWLAKAARELALREEKDRQGSSRGGLLHFVRYFWPVLEPERKLVEGWPLEAICIHLEAVSRGEFNRLLGNVPPGFMKSLLVNVFWPAWEWGALGKTHLRYLSFSYAAHLTERDNRKFLMLVQSHRYREMYPNVKLRKAGETLVTNSDHGFKLATSIGGVGTGERGDRVLLDDPHNVHEAESDAVRTRTVTWFREAMSNRLNDTNSAIVVIMQRVHESDVSGEILNEGLPYVHLCIPWEYDSARRCVTPVWEDPRSEDGEQAWLERFPESDLSGFRSRPVMWSGQYQQAPEPRGGNIFRREYWEPWTQKTYPRFDFVLASLDSAFTKNEANDPSALTVWGTYRCPKTGEPRVMLVMAWRKFLEIRGKRIERLPGETTPEYVSRTQSDWGLIEWTAHTCRKFKVEKLLVEAKASGLSVIQEMGKLYHGEGWATEPVTPAGDKVNRAHAVVGSFAEGLVSAPAIEDENGALAWRPWVQLVVDEAAVFPMGARKDLTDSTTQALRWLRMNGLLQMVAEAKEQEMDEKMHRPQPQPLYPSV